MITLGIDTSNYTTSAAVFNNGSYSMIRKILDVKEGSRGIRQSDGVFIHNRELPAVIEQMITSSDGKIQAVGVSTRPRSVDGSYMPVFTVGSGYAKVIAAAMGVKLHEFSHQDGHIMAGIFSSGNKELIEQPFISVHISGGTTEILKSEYNGYNFDNEIVGGTLDISAGQLIDRVGVAMGLKFPCGVKLEEMASEGSAVKKLPFSVKGGYMNLSGVETKILRDIHGPDCDTALTVLSYVRDVLIKTINNAIKETGISKVMVAGGVASNGIIRKGLAENINGDVFFASRKLSSDNAVGIAVLTAAAEGDFKWALHKTHSNL